MSTIPITTALVTYILDQSNSMADDIGYLEVKVSDGVSGAIDFAIRMLGFVNRRKQIS
ncbi:MAG: hypothetical protein WAU48_13770 [Gammaproteobacteria bacterium]